MTGATARQHLPGSARILFLLLDMALTCNKFCGELCWGDFTVVGAVALVTQIPSLAPIRVIAGESCEKLRRPLKQIDACRYDYSNEVIG